MMLLVKNPMSSVLGSDKTTSTPSSVLLISEIIEKADTVTTSGSEVSNLPAARLSEYITSSAVTTFPLWNFTLSRSLNTYLSPPSVISYEAATAGTKFPSLSTLIRPSKMLYRTSFVPAATALCGSRLSKSWLIPTTISPP